MIRPFEAEAFMLQPFSHGENYSDYEDYLENGVGAVVWHGDKIVASASSFLGHHGMVVRIICLVKKLDS